MTDLPPPPPPRAAASRRADAARNRARILDAARAAFAATGPDTSMAEVARRSGLGSATLYRNFATRRELLEALLVEEIDDVCAAAAAVQGDTPGERLVAWLRRFFRYVTDKRPVVIGLVEQTDVSNPVLNTRDRLLAAGQPLLSAAQDARQVSRALSLDQILDLVIAVAKIPGTRQHRQPIFDTALDGLCRQPPRPPT
ncbi:TetR/AcrR family transcriptional regulator [Actinoplanes sp. N902-109]|uniref:TetR/AcrR family transcriptional regulator n=1 Tax=Actinoplanes sp. (strain N902-109) TaxID=649831 RepID=UPI0018DC8E52|nr:TetR family transcriptional regulator [Actinoplanes sp. N902-109]